MDAPSAPAPTTQHGTSYDGALVSADWLRAHLNDPHVRVVEVDVSAAVYNEGHIEGAVLWNIYSDLKDAQYRTVGRSAVQRLAVRSGIDSDSTVVFYGYAPALGFWLMRLFGQADVHILDCSRETWRAKGGPVSTEAVTPAPGGFVPAAEDRASRAVQEAVVQAIGRPGTTLLDVRTAAEFRGERFWPSGAAEPGGRAGHIPSAIHQPIDGLYRDDGAFRPPADLRGVFAPGIIDGDDELIAYCTVGGRAATAWFVLTQVIGRGRVRVYDGSWAEWGHSAAPVAR